MRLARSVETKVPIEGLEQLLKFGGFPEPFLKGSDRFHRRWQNDYKALLTKEEVRDFSRIQDIKGLETMESLLAQWQTTGCRLRILTCGYVMARTYALLFQRAMETTRDPDSPQTRTMADKCNQWFQTCISEAREMGAHAMEGQALLGLGNALAVLGKPDQARKTLNQSVEILDKAKASSHLQQARALIESL